MHSFTLFNIICALLFLSPLSTAWPGGNLVPNNAKRTGTGTGTAEQTTGTGTNTGTKTGTNTAKTTGSSSSSSSLPPGASGGVNWLTPQTTPTPYFKIGDQVTLKWNYTSLAKSPSGVNVIASCDENHGTWTISKNMSVKPTASVVWDTKNVSKTNKLIMASYTLVVYDVDSSPDASSKPGSFGADKSLKFGLYHGQPYTPLSSADEFACVPCNGALSSVQVNGLKFAMGMFTLTVLSFTWFAGGLGIFST